MNRDPHPQMRRVAFAPGRATTVALVVVGLVLGGAVFAVGFLLLLALAAAGLALGAGWVLVQRVKRFLRRGRTREPRIDLLVEMGRARGTALDSWLETDATLDHRLDPSMEIGVIEPDGSLRSRPDSAPRPLPDTEPDRLP